MFNTKVMIAKSGRSITHADKILTLGSCFAENIGERMKQSWFEVDVNPFGVLFNPASICQSLQRLLIGSEFTPDDLFLNNELWAAFSHSTLFSDTSKEGCLQKINDRLRQAAANVSDIQYLILTLGTAWVYEEKSTGKVVANCHKLPAATFRRRRMSASEIVEQFKGVCSALIAKNPRLQIIFSVSPVRHWKDGAHENNLSKSTLLLAVDELEKEFDFVTYFPAYEIQMDELRDYRFYASDMLHPSEQAVDYIWQRFAETFFDDSTRNLKQEIEKYNHGLMHRPLFPQTEEYQKFQLFLEKKKEELLKKLEKIRL